MKIKTKRKAPQGTLRKTRTRGKVSHLTTVFFRGTLDSPEEPQRRDKIPAGCVASTRQVSHTQECLLKMSAKSGRAVLYCRGTTPMEKQSWAPKVIGAELLESKGEAVAN